jgi:hypothetical protein
MNLTLNSQCEVILVMKQVQLFEPEYVQSQESIMTATLVPIQHFLNVSTLGQALSLVLGY